VLIIVPRQERPEVLKEGFLLETAYTSLHPLDTLGSMTSVSDEVRKQSSLAGNEQLRYQDRMIIFIIEFGYVPHYRSLTSISSMDCSTLSAPI